MKRYSFWSIVATILAIRFAVEFLDEAIKYFARGLYKAGSFGDVFNKLEKAGIDIGTLFPDDNENTYKDKVVGFKTPYEED